MNCLFVSHQIKVIHLTDYSFVTEWFRFCVKQLTKFVHSRALVATLLLNQKYRDVIFICTSYAKMCYHGNEVTGLKQMVRAISDTLKQIVNFLI